MVNEDAFDKKSLEQAGYEVSPLEDGSLDSEYQLFKVPMTTLTRGAVDGLGLSQKAADRCRNFFAMGLVYWLYGRSLDPTHAIHRSQSSVASRMLPRPTNGP